ncbi:MAG: protein arginine kinase [Candidatus Omnitrophica bacterium]|nr:protein arginine kinase [Candidatus Omnitrophota bacterium]MBU0878343.1 protein arginine kinase [Candidatus Omnitrophota bacterium]MBU0896448.1 protein arginine kinase [Candidatus Omnitrophota bacterium]MBU1134286.1 protein arginine kinase [Candidatus Omnitrophota bacterium]MBU1366483.1 protein arginine kinase [Candidatus Omnitrophota bacterium]
MFEHFLTNEDSWLSGKGPYSEIVFSSRIRLARNLIDYPFPSRASNFHKEGVLQIIKEAYTKIKKLKDVIFVSMEDLSEIDRQFFFERHLISQEHIVTLEGKGLIVSRDEQIAIMINEEDHFRMQVIVSGFNLGECWQTLSEIDDELSRLISFTFSPDIGYLTACPTNVGTGLRASCMLHLPALVFTKKINKILELLAKISFTTRGLFGEGTQSLGNFFQISNQSSLGLSERELVDNLAGVVSQIKEQEMDVRSTLLKKYKASLQDGVWRALGILRNCRLISSKEALSHLSFVALGLDLGIIKGIPRESVNNLFIIIQPAHLQKIEGKSLKEDRRDYIRAAILREKLNINC